MSNDNEQGQRLVVTEDVKIGRRYRKDMGDVGSLAESMATMGLLHPIVVTPDGELIAGMRRLEAAKQLGWTEVPVTVVDLQDVMRGEYAENAIRKDFTPSEMVAIADALRPVEQAAAQERYEQTRPGVGGKFPPTEKGKARDKVAEFAGVSGRTLDKATAVVEAAEQDPDTYGHLIEEMDRTGKVDGAYKELKRTKAREAYQARIERAEEAKKTSLATTAPATYSLILADPPWRYDFSETQGRRIENKYDTIMVEEICEHRPPAGDNCVLLLWATAPKLLEALQVLGSWGFIYRTHAVWDKEKIGMGYWFRGQHELLLVGTKGKAGPPSEFARVSSIFREPRGEHSVKPKRIYEWIERAFPEHSKLEMYARHPRPGWYCWGNEV